MFLLYLRCNRAIMSFLLKMQKQGWLNNISGVHKSIFPCFLLVPWFSLVGGKEKWPVQFRLLLVRHYITKRTIYSMFWWIIISYEWQINASNIFVKPTNWCLHYLQKIIECFFNYENHLENLKPPATFIQT